MLDRDKRNTVSTTKSVSDNQNNEGLKIWNKPNLALKTQVKIALIHKVESTNTSINK